MRRNFVAWVCGVVATVGVAIQVEAGRQADAVSAALADASALPVPSVVRYVWLASEDDSEVWAVDTALNTACGQGLIARSVKVSDDLLRVDLSAYVLDDVAALANLIETWERFEGIEPYFLTDEIASGFVAIADTEVKVKSSVIGKIAKGESVVVLSTVDGTNGSRWHSVRIGSETGFVPVDSLEIAASGRRVFGVHTGEDGPSLAALCGTAVPFVRSDWLVSIMLSTADRGLYYEFRGIKASADPKVSDFDRFLLDFAGVTDQDVAKLGGDSKVAMFRSRVTGKPRAVVLCSGPQAKAPVNQGLIAITQDPADEDIDPGSDPLLNLSRAKYAAIEVFAELPNGLIAYGLYSGDLDGDGKFDPAKGEGKIQREAPPNIVTDHTIPAPHTARLQPAVSCIRCHMGERGGVPSDGWIDAPNDVQRLIASKIDVFGDVKLTGGGVRRLAALYAGDWEKPFGRARADHNDALLEIVKGVPIPEDGSIVSVAHGAVCSVYARHEFDLVTPEVAAKEFGLSVPEGQTAADVLNQRCRLPAGSLEDVRIASILAGIGVNRRQFESVWPVLALRIDATGETVDPGQ